jgi:mannose-P-dolichol utilization defect protein 1
VFNFLVGSLTRIFTTIQEVDDPLILYGFVAGFAFNAILAIQMVYYWNTPTKKSAPAIRVQGEKGKPAVSSGSQPKTRGPSTRRRA